MKLQSNQQLLGHLDRHTKTFNNKKWIFQNSSHTPVSSHYSFLYFPNISNIAFNIVVRKNFYRIKFLFQQKSNFKMPRPVALGDRNFKEIKNKLLKKIKQKQDEKIIQDVWVTFVILCNRKQQITNYFSLSTISRKLVDWS